MSLLRNKNSKDMAISGYKPFYIQRGTTVYDTRAHFGMIAKTNPYPALPTPKEPYSNDWLDEDGHDEYNKTIFYEPIDLSVSFYVKAIDDDDNTAIQNLRGWLDDFFRVVRNGEFLIYDAYTGIGYRKVRYDGYTEDTFISRDNYASLVFTVKFKANDPITRVSYLGGAYPGIYPKYAGRCTTQEDVKAKNVVCYGGDAVINKGDELAVLFTEGNNHASPSLSVSFNYTKPITNIPMGGIVANQYYLFEYTGSAWDCKGLL